MALNLRLTCHHHSQHHPLHHVIEVDALQVGGAFSLLDLHVTVCYCGLVIAGFLGVSEAHTVSIAAQEGNCEVEDATPVGRGQSRPHDALSAPTRPSHAFTSVHIARSFISVILSNSYLPFNW